MRLFDEKSFYAPTIICVICVVHVCRCQQVRIQVLQ